MKSSAFFSIFPPTKYVSMSSVGIDISDQSLRYVELLPCRGGLKLGRFGEKKVPPGVMLSGKISDTKKMIEILSELKKEVKINFVRVSLPEEQIYLYKTKIPILKNDEIKNALELQLEEHIPISPHDAVFDYDLVKSTEDSYEIEVAAINETTVETYTEIFHKAGLMPLSFELEASAIARAIVLNGTKGTILFVDFGETRTGISVVTDGIVQYTSTVDIGGSMLTSMIQKEMNLSYEQAEAMKKKNGLIRGTDGVELSTVLLGAISILRDEINKNFVYWHTHKDEDGNDRPKIEKIILCGGDSNLKGLVDYLETSMRLPIVLGDVWVNINKSKEFVPEIFFGDSLSYVTALGLALGDFTND